MKDNSLVAFIDEVQNQDNSDMELVTLNNQSYFKISNVDHLRSFFMSIVSDSNHWLFISSNGGLTAGRKNAEYALFPYYTDDKITESADITGSKTIFQIHHGGKIILWEPFSDRFNDAALISRNLYKSFYGNSLVFEEVHHDLQLTFRYSWQTSDQYGFVRSCELINHAENDYTLHILDGIQNVIPQGVSADLQNATSNLVDAYKRNELVGDVGLGIYALSAVIVDKAEPSEALKANIVWSLGMDNPKYLVSSQQVARFRKKMPIVTEYDIKGEKGAYFVVSESYIVKGNSLKWQIVADVNYNQSRVVERIEALKSDSQLAAKVAADIELGTQKLIALNATADGLQFTADIRKDARHFSNVLFNSMRGGIFDHNYQVEKQDFLSYLSKANSKVANQYESFFALWPEHFDYAYLKKDVASTNNEDLMRLAVEYLPLKFSRRHGDPSRPWNKFSINTRNEIDGSKILDYEGNWRDIFQNWESLVYAFPDFIDGMITKFLNSSTFDGYNPYRVTKSGFDWETIEPDNPWSYIGYWGDHQLIYLLKFLEFKEKYQPNSLHQWLDKEQYVYAAVPYRIKDYEAIVRNPKDTIAFDWEWDKRIHHRKAQLGADGALLTDKHESIYRVTFIEKILATVLAKMANFIPEGGIWMNTQRPEWNDANNALVGNGVSMVTLYYLRRFLTFLNSIIENAPQDTIKISGEMVEFYHTIREGLEQRLHWLQHSISDAQRKELVDCLAKASSEYRSQIYESGFWGKKRTHSMDGLKRFVSVSLQFIEHTIEANKRNDNLYHAYNLMDYSNDGISIAYLPEMLEGQVAVISSGYLSPKATVQTLDALRKSALYRPDQESYILYPNKELPKFLAKNTLPSDQVHTSKLLQSMLQFDDKRLINMDMYGKYHFNGNFHNANDVSAILEVLAQESKYASLVAKESQLILQLFETVFNHKAFTGRSGTFYGYEGLGSIYWHMVSKLVLAVAEIYEKAVLIEESTVTSALANHFHTINAGIGVHKQPKVYGAFPTDPYSHTPLHRGAQQPGMTGQVKEDILARNIEFGVQIDRGQLRFSPRLLSHSVFSKESKTVNLVDLSGTFFSLELPENSLAFTVAQVPVIYTLSSEPQLKITFYEEQEQLLEGDCLPVSLAAMIFSRKGRIHYITVYIQSNQLQ
ncbi:MAG: hypothetical protein RLZZ500_792 [Bacteroidota bacterium]|jgi:hypothetical protein